LLTFVGIPAFNALAGDFAFEEKIPVDWRVMLFTLGISLFTAILFGIAPAIQASRVNPNVSLREGERQSVGKSRGYARQALAVVEIAMAMVLLVGAGLLIDSILRLKDVNPGFDARNVLTAQVQLPEGGKWRRRAFRQMSPRADSLLRFSRGPRRRRMPGRGRPTPKRVQDFFRQCAFLCARADSWTSTIRRARPGGCW
jgi:hypothetical protein